MPTCDCLKPQRVNGVIVEPENVSRSTVYDVKNALVAGRHLERKPGSGRKLISTARTSKRPWWSNRPSPWRPTQRTWVCRPTPLAGWSLPSGSRRQCSGRSPCFSYRH
ncbi:Hypothetical protein FKW44_014893 [Caligus rogercresseyi]|uniref:Uncharacterized protein n=1 Tax=Caligus rogercresseyi TaxID=217165 RepID=A0A7T8GZN4_CALRO|nr:Hypothetical protein FKW44_014893 [Caligus rogercresseyi]